MTDTLKELRDILNLQVESQHAVVTMGTTTWEINAGGRSVNSKRVKGERTAHGGVFSSFLIAMAGEGINLNHPKIRSILDTVSDAIDNND